MCRVSMDCWSCLYINIYQRDYDVICYGIRDISTRQVPTNQRERVRERDRETERVIELFSVSVQETEREKSYRV